jgi:hypothetical protein
MLFGLPWTAMLLIPVGTLSMRIENPIISRVVEFVFFVVISGGINSYWLYKAICAFQEGFQGATRPTDLKPK